MKNDTFTVEQAADRLGKNPQVVRRACKRLNIPKLGRYQYIIDNKIIALLQSEISSPGVHKNNKKNQKKKKIFLDKIS